MSSKKDQIAALYFTMSDIVHRDESLKVCQKQFTILTTHSQFHSSQSFRFHPHENPGQMGWWHN